MMDEIEAQQGADVAKVKPPRGRETREGRLPNAREAAAADATASEVKKSGAARPVKGAEIHL